MQDIEALEEYQSAAAAAAAARQGEIHAVLNSPLPVNLAEFGAFGGQVKEEPVSQHSPSPDSPGFAYPTPPASQVSFLQNILFFFTFI